MQSLIQWALATIIRESSIPMAEEDYSAMYMALQIWLTGENVSMWRLQSHLNMLSCQEQGTLANR